MNLYGSKLVKIPEPKFVVFYNGTDNLPERSELRLSGYNDGLVEKCKTLKDYMIFVSRIRELKRRTDNEISIYCRKEEKDKVEKYIWERIGGGKGYDLVCFGYYFSLQYAF